LPSRNDVVLLAPRWVVFRKINAAMCATAFFSCQCAASDCLHDRQHGFQVRAKMPARIEHPCSAHADPLCPFPELRDLLQGRLQRGVTAATSPAANKPGTVVASVSASPRTPPIM